MWRCSSHLRRRFVVCASRGVEATWAHVFLHRLAHASQYCNRPPGRFLDAPTRRRRAVVVVVVVVVAVVTLRSTSSRRLPSREISTPVKLGRNVTTTCYDFATLRRDVGRRDVGHASARCAIASWSIWREMSVVLILQSD